MQKKILTGKEVRDVIYTGVKKVADAVVSTLGPMGKNVIISRCFPSQNGMQYYMPQISKDGVTVARNITLDNQLENTGANLIKQAAEKTMMDSGDGTTTTCLLTMAILEEGIKAIDGGANSQELKKQIDTAVGKVVQELKKMAVPIDNDIEKIRNVATVSANNDKVIGDLIAEAFSKIGKDGIIDIQESGNAETKIEIASGIKIERGWESQYFITNKAKNECELNDVYILLYDKKISKIEQFGNSLSQLIQDRKEILIICEEADGEALAAMAMNAQDGSIRNCMIKCPEFGEKKREFMEDLAAITGATYISDEKGRELKKLQPKDFGRAKKVVISKNETSIISPVNDKEELSELLDNLKMDLVNKEGEEKDAIEKRIARLTGSVAVLYVGANTEVEMKEKKDRCDDAVRATRAANSEGFVPGGGTAFLRIESGSELIDTILLTPLLQICSNAGVDGKNILSQVMSSKGDIGYNAKENKIEDLVKAGIIDPVKVLRNCIENAASVATTILTSNTLICDSL